MSTTWQSTPIPVDGIEAQVYASADGVTLGMVVNGTYASDLLLTPKQARQLAADLQAGAHESESVTST
ncbi:hypothetical protein [Rhodanobacter geophilus]|uniref:Uncharacterized protein n=1 Tax=Rhodanobacter geophilus TaxID=3162488 RepID=A0ABV3QKX2_9GAMM